MGAACRVGVLSPFSSSFGPGPSFEAFRETLRELGYVEGRNIALEYRWADGRYDRLPGLTTELVRLQVDVIFSAWSTPVALATKKGTSTIPIVFAGVGDAVGVGLVAAAERLSAARAFIERFPAATEILIVAASRDAADDLARRITLTRGATFGLHRASFVQLVVRLAMADMALRGFGHSAARADTIPDRETPARLEDVDIRPQSPHGTAVACFVSVPPTSDVR